MGQLFLTAAFAAVLLTYGVYRRYSRVSLAKIPGPKPASFLLGNLCELYQGQAGEADFKWQKLYGNVIRYKGALGEDILMVSDPKALQYIFQTSGYHFPKLPERRVLSRMLTGRGVTWAEGDDHKRQRKVILPGFGGPESKAFLTLFKGCAESMTTKWMEVVSNSEEQSIVLNIPAWMSRATLDAIGEAAFDYKFGSVENQNNPLAHTYSNMMTDIFGSPSATQLFVQSLFKYLPMSAVDYLSDHGTNRRLMRMRETNGIARNVAKGMVKEKAESLLEGEGSRDVFSLLVKANMAENAKAKLSEEELLAQMSTILFAGHETTSNTVSWALLELAKHPEIQTKLRSEIRATDAAIHARGQSDFTVADFEAMPYTTAVMKEVLRFHSVAYHSHRCAGRDDVLPLSQPIVTDSGEVIHEVPIPKGTRIVASIAAYNRNEDLWGDDAHIFNPDRWLSGAAGKKGSSIGVYGNLMTFLGGIRSCIGWRFAVIEIQAFLVEIINKFEFSVTDKTEHIRREACLVMAPTVEGELEKGVQLPLRVSIAARDE
ncbi:cytochrome P450 [Leucogyrophana mollusca]|uniref:Cytochrome P450 n=1 Tax=Leucogyrophana mollusca TaxID=85980 RepID=A0ACB8B8Z7_9AGAM|nr:cytochrome P450 [Leucogyrophana mollusca]